MQANQGQPVAEEQMIEIEARIAQLIAEGMQALKQLSQAIAGGGEQQPDPLVALKERELQIRETQVQADIQQDQAELDFDRQRAQQKAAEFQQRISSQERQTFARIEAGAERERMRQLQEMRRGPGQ